MENKLIFTVEKLTNSGFLVNEKNVINGKMEMNYYSSTEEFLNEISHKIKIMEKL